MNDDTPKIQVGDLVRRNPATWVPNEFDAAWGRGDGVGIVVEPPHRLPDDEVDVRWEKGKCFEGVVGLIKVG